MKGNHSLFPAREPRFEFEGLFTHEDKQDAPSDEFEFLLTDRVANFSYAVRYVEQELREAKDYPIVLLAVEHDGYSDDALPKKITNKGSRG